MTITLRDSDGSTELLAVHEGVPPGVAPEDNELGWRMALDRLAALVEGRPTPASTRPIIAAACAGRRPR